MVAPFELVMKDSALQENWFRRVIALIIDAVILGIVYAILSAVLLAGLWATRGGFGLGGFGFASIFGVGAFIYWIMWILYFAVTESTWGASIGKMALSMRVVGEDGNKPEIKDAFIRNVSRIHGLLFLLDLIGGLVMEGDPRQRFADRISNTVVYQKDSKRGGPYVQPSIIKPEGGQAAPAAPPSKPAEKPAEEGEPEEPAAAAGETKAFCRHCGAPVDPDSTFCPKCGKKL